MHVCNSVGQGSRSRNDFADSAGRRIRRHGNSLADRDLVTVDARVGLGEIRLVALELLHDLLAIVALDHQIYRLHGGRCTRHDACNRAI